MTFMYDGREYDLLDHRHNSTITNERAVEVPIALDFVSKQSGSGLEVGNVLGHYGCTAPRRIVDRYEQGVYVENFDVFDIADRYDWIVSVSTIEHIRNDPAEPSNPWGAVAALTFMRGLLRDGGRMLVTVGLGQNPMLDEFLVSADVWRVCEWTNDRFRQNDRILRRTRGATPADNAWAELSPDQWLEPPDDWDEYGPTHGANAVWIGEWGPT